MSNYVKFIRDYAKQYNLTYDEALKSNDRKIAYQEHQMLLTNILLNVLAGSGYISPDDIQKNNLDNLVIKCPNNFL